jgi:protocatechuate 3,4-dioxygenase beta subunit
VTYGRIIGAGVEERYSRWKRNLQQRADRRGKYPSSLALGGRVNDQYGNPVPGASVSFSDGAAGGAFATNPLTTDSTGTASATYTTPPSPGQVTVNATVAGVATAVNFIVSVQ